MIWIIGIIVLFVLVSVNREEIPLINISETPTQALINTKGYTSSSFCEQRLARYQKPCMVPCVQITQEFKNCLKQEKALISRSTSWVNRLVVGRWTAFSGGSGGTGCDDLRKYEQPFYKCISKLAQPIKSEPISDITKQTEIYTIGKTKVSIDVGLHRNEILDFLKKRFDLTGITSIALLNRAPLSGSYPAYYYKYDRTKIFRIYIYDMQNKYGSYSEGSYPSWKYMFCHEYGHFIGWKKIPQDLSEGFAWNYADSKCFWKD